MNWLKMMTAVLAVFPFLSHGQSAHPPEMHRASQVAVKYDAESELYEEHQQQRTVCQFEEGSNEILYLTHRLYGAARFEGEDELSGEAWREIIENPCSVEVILDWREGVSFIVDGLSDHGGAEIIDRLIDRSLAAGSLYLYIALAPYANADMQEKYASYFLADDAFRDVFESRLAKAKQQKNVEGR